MKISFVLIGEGSSDLRMVDHIENILVTEGFDEVSGNAFDPGSASTQPIGRSVKEKLCAAMKLFPSADIVVIHRDSDGHEWKDREEEITNAKISVAATNDKAVVSMIPVRMLETWLIACNASINIVAGNNNPQSPIRCIPALRNLERAADTKNLLKDALCEASGLSGGRLNDFKRRFFQMRARITDDLSIDGPQNNLPSYERFRIALSAAAQEVRIRKQEKNRG